MNAIGKKLFWHSMMSFYTLAARSDALTTYNWHHDSSLLKRKQKNQKPITQFSLINEHQCRLACILAVASVCGNSHDFVQILCSGNIRNFHCIYNEFSAHTQCTHKFAWLIPWTLKFPRFALTKMKSNALLSDKHQAKRNLSTFRTHRCNILYADH